MTTTQHPLNRHLFIADNLELLRSLDNESINLICIDPPFAKNQTWVGSLKPPLTEQELRQELETLASWGITSQEQAVEVGIEWPQGGNDARFKDIWRWENDVHEDWVQRIEQDYEPLAKVIDATRLAHSEGTAAYLTYIAIRVIEMHRVLKPTGSIYFHCDHTAGAYIRQMLDAIFGNGQNGSPGFRNEIAWRRYGSHNDAVRRYGQVRDTILFYVKSKQHNWNDLREGLDPEYVKTTYRHQDHRGYYRTAPLHTGGLQGKGYEYDFRGYRREWRYPEHRMTELEQDDRIRQGRNGQGVPERKVYLNETHGKPLSDWWHDIASLTGQNKERSGYPTQKPVALAERILLASSNPHDVVLDCFAGCAYVPVAAERNGRQWIACDISPRALTVLRRQFAKFHYAVDGEQTAQQPALITVANVTTRGPHQLPERSDEDPITRHDIEPLPPRAFKIPASIIPDKEMLEFLLQLSGYTAWCCGFANRMPDSAIIRTTRNFHLDHIDPRSKDGSNQITNRAPLCPDHNIRKNNRRVHLAEYREEIAHAGEMMVNSSNELIHLAWAAQQALDYYALARSKSGHQLNLEVPP